MADDHDDQGAENPTADMIRFEDVVSAIDLGDRKGALQLLREVECLDKADIAVLCDLLDDEKSFTPIHPFRLELLSRAGVGRPRTAKLNEVEADAHIAHLVAKAHLKSNLKTAIHNVAVKVGKSTSWVQQARLRAKNRSPFSKPNTKK